MNRPKLSIIIVNWNTKILLGNCLKSILDNQQSTRFAREARRANNKPALPAGRQLTVEIIVVDNGSTDNSVDYLKRLVKNHRTPDTRHYTLRVIYNTDNLGFGKANNQGIKVAQGDYIMLLNSDTVVKPGAIERLVNYLKTHPDTAVSPQLVLSNNQPQNDYYMKFPNPWQISLYHNPLLRPLAVRLKTTRKLLFNPTNVNNFAVDQLPGAALTASKETWGKVGGLDETYKFFFEDVDWSWRAMQKGIKRVVVPTAKVVHLGGASWKQKLESNKMLVYQQNFSSMLLFCQKNYPDKKYQLMRWAVVLNMIITFKFNLVLYFIRTPTKQTNLW